MRRTWPVGTVAVLLLAGATTACTSSNPGVADAGTNPPTIVQPGAPGEPSRLLDANEVSSLRTEAGTYTEADVAFMQGMIVHHAQALRMTRMVPTRAADTRIVLIAQRMDISQEAEIELMRAWLEARDEPVPRSVLAGHDHGARGSTGALMPGMLTEDELATLENATGDVFDRAFLEAMVAHHEGGIAMVDALYEQGGGVEPEAFQLTNHMRTDQAIDVDRMANLLAEHGGGLGVDGRP